MLILSECAEFRGTVHLVRVIGQGGELWNGSFRWILAGGFDGLFFEVERGR